MYKLLHMFAKLSIKLMYRVKIQGRSVIPSEGAALLAPNHVSYVDALMLLAKSKRPMRFVMWYKIYELPVLRHLFKALKIIPIGSPQESMKHFRGAFKEIAVALKGGELVVFFPEGAITRDGNLQEIKGGIEYVIKKNPVPVIPVGISGLYGSHFSRAKKKRFFGKWLAKVYIKYGNEISPEQVSRQRVESDLVKLI